MTTNVSRPQAPNSLTFHLHFSSQFIVPPLKMPASHYHLSLKPYNPFHFSQLMILPLLLKKIKALRKTISFSHNQIHLSIFTAMNILYHHQWTSRLCQCLRLTLPAVHLPTSSHLHKGLAAATISCYSKIKFSLPTGSLSSVHKLTALRSTLTSTHPTVAFLDSTHLPLATTPLSLLFTAKPLSCLYSRSPVLHLQFSP